MSQNKGFRLNILTIDIISCIALIISICGIIICIQEITLFSTLGFIFSILLINLAGCYLIATACVRIEYKIKKKKKISREYYLNKDIISKDVLFKFAVSLAIIIIIVIISILVTC